jgi:hypothetical protein
MLPLLEIPKGWAAVAMVRAECHVLPEKSARTATALIRTSAPQ